MPGGAISGSKGITNWSFTKIDLALRSRICVLLPSCYIHALLPHFLPFSPDNSVSLYPISPSTVLYLCSFLCKLSFSILPSFGFLPTPPSCLSTCQASTIPRHPWCRRKKPPRISSSGPVRTAPKGPQISWMAMRSKRNSFQAQKEIMLEHWSYGMSKS